MKAAILFFFTFIFFKASFAKVLEMKVFTRNTVTVGTSHVAVPTRPNSNLYVESEGYRCEIDSLDVREGLNNIHMTFSGPDSMTAFNGTVDLSNDFYISLNDKMFCQLKLLELKDKNGNNQPFEKSDKDN